MQTAADANDRIARNFSRYSTSYEGAAVRASHKAARRALLLQASNHWRSVAVQRSFFRGEQHLAREAKENAWACIAYLRTSADIGGAR
jgi:hypothetical protein